MGANTFSLRMDVSALKSQLRELERTDEDASRANGQLDKLAEELAEDIKSDRTQIVVEAVLAMKDNAAASMSDGQINQAKGNIEREIATIEAAIKAQKDAARALSGGKGW